MPSQDRLYHYMLAKGAEAKQIATVQGSLDFICHYYSLQPVPGSKALKKKILGSLRERIDQGEDLTRDKIVVSALSIISPEAPYNERDLFLARSRGFYRSQRWRNLRLMALERGTGRCEACGSGVKDGVVLHVDHILPRSIYPEHAFSLNNLQVLCESCNMGKGNVHTTNFRDRNKKDAPSRDS